MDTPRSLLDLLESQKRIEEERERIETERKRIKRAVGSELRSYRRALGVMQNDVASATGISQAYLSMVENGEKTPSDDVVNSLIGALNTLGGAHASKGAREDIRKARGRK